MISRTDPATMSNREIVAEYDRTTLRKSKIVDELIEDGFHDLRPSDMRANPDVHPLAREDLELSDRRFELRAEADKRYGPGLMLMDQLVAGQGGSYRRVKK